MTTPPEYEHIPEYMSRDDKDGQFVYLVEAKGFHGIFSFVLKRRKIGLSNNPERRLKELNSEQAPCPIIGVRYIQVKDSRKTEAELHELFVSRRRHGEWFDFWIWEMPIVNWHYERHAAGTVLNKLPVRAIAYSCLVTGLVVGTVVAGISYRAVQYKTDSPVDAGGVRHLE
jgi:hypothetical protein